MKFGLYTDTHFGIYGDDDKFLDYQLSIIKKIHDDFISKNIDMIIIPGDIFDNRMRLNVKTLNKVKDFYLKECEKFEFVITLGNHDYFNKNDSNYSSVIPVFRDINNVHVLGTKEMSLEDYDGFKILYCNWIFDEQHFKNELQKYKEANLVIGHFEMKDFEMVKGHMMKTGMDKSIFKTKELVLSGHYHCSDHKDNIQYLGTPYQMDWSDFCEKKYYYVYDTDKRHLQEHEQKDMIFIQVKMSEITTDNFERFKNKIVKIIIDVDDFDKEIITKIQEANPYKLQIVDNRELIKDVETEIDTNSDVLTVSKEYIEKNLKDEIDKDKLFDIFSEIYKEAKVL